MFNLAKKVNPTISVTHESWYINVGHLAFESVVRKQKILEL